MNQEYSPLLGKCSEIDEIESLESSIIIRNYINELGIDVSPYFNKKPKYKIKLCKKSGFRFYDPLSLAGDSSFYEKLQKLQNNYYTAIRPEFIIAKKYIKKNAKVLDVGCGKGYFLDYIKDITKNLSGIEYYEEAIKVNIKKGYNCYNIPIERFGLEHVNKFDVVTAFHVLEHIPNPNSFLNAAIHLLNENGILIIATPNSIQYTYDKYHPLNNPPHHINLWNKNSLKKLDLFFNLESIKVVDLKSIPVDYRKIKAFLNINLSDLMLLRIFLKIIFSPFLEGDVLIGIYKKKKNILPE
ncbi:MAG: class I SAM-dependent methyltransferase [bacterium]